MTFADDHPGYRIQTEEEARNWMLELVEGVKAARAQCDIIVPARPDIQAETQRRAYRKWLTKHGAALGTLMALHRCGKLGDVAYNELREQVMATMTPTLVGSTQ